MHSDMSGGETRQDYLNVLISYTDSYFIKQTRYWGTYAKINSAQGAATYRSRNGDEVVVGVASASTTPVWNIDSVALNSNLKKLTTPSVATDLNKISETGVTSTDGNTSHSPGAWYVVYTIVTSSTSAVQFALRITSPAFYVRCKSGGTWSEWKYATLT